VLNAVVESGLAPVFYHNSVEVAKQIVAACAKGGARVVEFHQPGRPAWNVLPSSLNGRRKRTWGDPGRGSDHRRADGGGCTSAAGQLCVGPILNPEIARCVNRRKVAYMPGCGSANPKSPSGGSWRRDRQGLSRRRGSGGAGFVKAVLAPMP